MANATDKGFIVLLTVAHQKNIFGRSNKKGMIDSFTPDGGCWVSCCHSLICQSKGKAASARIACFKDSCNTLGEKSLIQEIVENQHRSEK